jgi:ribosomal-protein-alanine N-acetyltransferase
MIAEGDIFIRGEGICLRAPQEADLNGGWYGWFNDPEVNAYQNKGFYPNTREKQAEFFHSLKADASQVPLAIVSADTGLHIGNATLRDINWIHRSAELGIVLGDKDHRGKGFGRQAWWLVARYGFLTLNLNRITATMIKENERSLRSALRSGFQVEGELKEFYFKNGSYHDLIVTGITAARWKKCFGADAALPFSRTGVPPS